MRCLRLDESGTSADATDAAPSGMTIGDLEMLPSVERTVRSIFKRAGLPFSDKEARHISEHLLELSACDIAEIYSPPRLTARTSSFGMVPGFCVWDLSTTRADGTPWDFSRAEDKKLLEQLQQEEKPELLVGSPPRTDCCALLRLSMTEAQVEERKEASGKPHIRTCCSADWGQVEEGSHFLHEHPNSAG